MTDPIRPTDEAFVEELARAICRADGLDYDEVCGREADPYLDECDSGTCPAAYWEEHDAEDARRWYKHFAQAAITALQPAIDAAREEGRRAGLEEAAKVADEHAGSYSRYESEADACRDVARDIRAKGGDHGNAD